MITIRVRSDFSKVLKMFEELPDQIQSRAVNMALNKVADKGRTEMVRAITSTYSIKSGEVREQVKVARANKSSSNLSVAIEAFGVRKGHRSRNVMLFNARQTKKGVSLKIKKGGGRKTIQHAFIANNGRTVFIREGKSRLPIKAVETIDVPQMFNTKTVNAKVVARIRKELPVEVRRAIAVVLDRYK